MSSKIRVFAVVLIIALFMAVPVSAQAYVVPLSVDQMAGMADTIVEVSVGSAGSRWSFDPLTRERAAIVTDVRFHVAKVLKGDKPAAFVLSQLGGSVGGDGLAVSEMAEFTPGERCILFLDENGIIGGRQGKLDIVDGVVPTLGVSLEAAEARIAGSADVAVTLTDVTETVLVAPLLVGDVSASDSVGIVPLGDVGTQAMTVFESTFEGGSTSGWTMLGAPTWGATAYRAQAGSYSLYGSGAGVGSVPAPGPCPVSVSAAAQRVFSLSTYNVATLEWDAYSDMVTSGSNWMNVALATSSGGPWYYPNSTFTLGDTGGWAHRSLDLRSVTDQFGAGTMDFTGRSTVYLRLVWVHADGATDEGVYVDNVTLTGDNVVCPEIDSISPSYADAGVGDEITISGTAFGASQGSGSVTFLRGDAQDGSRVSGSIVSWSDTEIVCVVPRLAESGAVVVTTDSGVASSGYTYKIGFSAGNLTWPTSTVTYDINENTSDITGEGAAIRRALDSWSDCGSQLTLAYGGTCSTTAYPPARDGSFDIYFNAGAGFPTGVLAMNYYWYSGSTKLESDIIFNDSFNWADGAVSGRFDVETVALHELGHTVGLDDQYGDLDEAMGAGPSGATRRALSSYDVAGAIYIWGTSTAPDLTAPAAPAVTSSTHPSQSTWYDDPAPAFSFSASDPSGIDGYSYVLDASAVTVPDQVVDGAGSAVAYSGITDGEWYFHVRAVDGAGNWSTTTHYRVRIDTSEPLTVIEVEGTSRFDTAVETSKVAFPSGASTVVIATGRNWPDALGGSALAGAVGGPILLADTHEVPDSVLVEIGRLEATHAIVLGSESALGLGVEADLLGAGLTVERIGGAGRYQTAELIAQAAIARLGDFDGTAFVATGLNFPDALAASPMAAANGWPVFLANPNADPDDLAGAMASYGVTDALVLGGENVVSVGYYGALQDRMTSVDRLFGTSRYETGRAVAQYAVDHGGLSFDAMAIGVGNNFPDALAGGALCAQRGSVLLLTDPYSLSGPTCTLLEDNKLGIGTIHFLGSDKALTPAVRAQVIDILE